LRDRELKRGAPESRCSREIFSKRPRGVSRKIQKMLEPPPIQLKIAKRLDQKGLESGRSSPKRNNQDSPRKKKDPRGFLTSLGKRPVPTGREKKESWERLPSSEEGKSDTRGGERIVI